MKLKDFIISLVEENGGIGIVIVDEDELIIPIEEPVSAEMLREMLDAGLKRIEPFKRRRCAIAIHAVFKLDAETREWLKQAKEGGEGVDDFKAV